MSAPEPSIQPVPKFQQVIDVLQHGIRCRSAPFGVTPHAIQILRPFEPGYRSVKSASGRASLELRPVGLHPERCRPQVIFAAD